MAGPILRVANYRYFIRSKCFERLVESTETWRSHIYYSQVSNLAQMGSSSKRFSQGDEMEAIMAKQRFILSSVV